MDILGYRSKLGVIAASVNAVTAPSTIPLCPPGTSIHYSDFLAHDDVIDVDAGWRRSQPALPAALAPALERMQSRAPGIIGLFLDEELLGSFSPDCLTTLRRAPHNQPIILPSEALAAAAARTGWTSKVGVISPFFPDDHIEAIAALRRLGYDVVADFAMSFDRPMAPAHTSFVALREAYQKLIDQGVEHVIQLGHNLPFAKLVANLEEDYGKPILAINQVCLWHMLRTACIEDLVPYVGQLFLDY